jgi:uncharacterized protein (DUF362 family)
MSNLSRREFLRRSAAGVGVLAGGWLSACSRQVTPASVSPTPLEPSFTPTGDQAGQPVNTVEQADSATATPGETGQAVTAPPNAYPDLVVGRGGEPEALVRQSLTALGGMERFVMPGADVIVKPNICVAYHSYEYAATTNPWVVGSLVKLALEAGAGRVRVLDYPFGGSPEAAYARSGIQEQVLAAGGEMETMSNFKFVSTDIPAGQDLHQVDLYDDILHADVLIDVPVAKHHSLAKLTLGMKNLLGVIRNRSALHRNLGQRIADLTSLIQPTLTVVDAVRILTAHGPSGGSLDDVKKLDTIIASPDIVAADSYAATVFGLQPHDLAYIQAGTAMGLGRSDLHQIKIEELTVGG